MDEIIGDMVKTTTRGGLILFIGQIMSTFILAFGMMIVGRLLGSQKYGEFNAAQSVVQIGALVIYLGIQPALVKYVAQYRHEKKHAQLKTLIESGVLLSLISSTTMFFILNLSAEFIASEIYSAPEQARYIRFLSIGLLGQALIQSSMGITTGYERMKMRAAVNFVYSLFKSVASPVLVYLGLGILGAVLGHSLPQVLAGSFGLILILFLRRRIPFQSNGFTHIEAMKMILGYGWPIYLSSLLGGVLPHLYTLLASKYAGFELVGNYSAAINFGVLVSFVSVPIGTAIFPLFSKLDSDSDELGFLFMSSVKYTTLLGYPVAFTIMALADQFITIIFTNEYPFAAHYLRLYMLSFIFMGLGSVCNVPLLNSQKKTTTIFRSTLVRFVCAVPLSLLLIPRFQVVGLTATIFLMVGLNTVLNYNAILRFFGFTIDLSFLAKMLAISAVSYFSVYNIVTFLDVNQWIELFIGGALSLLIYFVGLLTLRAFSRRDLIQLKKLTSGLGPLSPLIGFLADFMMRYSQ